MTDDLVQWLGEQLVEEAEAARALLDDRRFDRAQRWEFCDDGAIRDAGGHRSLRVKFTWSPEAEHIVRHDPARVLREIDAKRQLLADFLAEPHFRNEEDNWYTCAALVDEDGEPVCIDESRAPGPCDCGRDARVHRRAVILALPYADRPDYREEWRS